MSHKLIALIVRAANELEAEEKAWTSIDHICCQDYPNPDDYGIVVRSKEDLARGELNDTQRWVCDCDEHRVKTQYVRTAPVNSEFGRKFIASSYPEYYSPSDNSDSLTALADSGYFVRDEEGNYIPDPNDARLHSDEYFVVPVDIHS